MAQSLVERLQLDQQVPYGHNDLRPYWFMTIQGIVHNGIVDQPPYDPAILIGQEFTLERSYIINDIKKNPNGLAKSFPVITRLYEPWTNSNKPKTRIEEEIRFGNVPVLLAPFDSVDFLSARNAMAVLVKPYTIARRSNDLDIVEMGFVTLPISRQYGFICNLISQI